MDQSLQHGERYTYVKHKCRCKECREANTKYKSDKTAYYRAVQASKDRSSISTDAQAFLDSLTHGIPSTYEWYQCRCEQCKQAKREVSNSYLVCKVLST